MRLQMLHVAKSVVLSGVLLFVSFGITASSKEANSIENNTAVNLVEEITTGHVIVYGRPILPSYKVALKNDTVYINDIRIEPPIQKSGPEISSALLTELGKNFSVKDSIFRDSCFTKYAIWYWEYGEEETMEKLEEYIKTQRLVPIREYKLTPGSLWYSCNYKYPDLYYYEKPSTTIITIPDIWYGLSLYLSPYRENKIEYEARIKAQVGKNMQERFETTVNMLKKNYLLITGLGYLMGTPDSMSQRVFYGIRAILCSPVSDSLKREQLKKLLSGLPPIYEIYDDLIENQQAWLEVK